MKKIDTCQYALRHTGGSALCIHPTCVNTPPWVKNKTAIVNADTCGTCTAYKIRSDK